jgi:hypothetical protein
MAASAKRLPNPSGLHIPLQPAAADEDSQADKKPLVEKPRPRY